MNTRQEMGEYRARRSVWKGGNGVWGVTALPVCWAKGCVCVLLSLGVRVAAQCMIIPLSVCCERGKKREGAEIDRGLRIHRYDHTI